MESIVYLVRHPAVPGWEERFLGQSDPPANLPERIRIPERIDSQKIERILTSPLRRCLNFAEMMSEQLQVPIETIPGSEEIHFGDWEGVEYTEVHRLYSEKFQDWGKNFLRKGPPNGESLEEFYKRISRMWETIRSKRNGSVFVCHAGVIRAIICLELGLNLEKFFLFSLEHSSWSAIRVHLASTPGSLAFLNILS